MPSRTRLHDDIPHAVLHEAYCVFQHSIAFHTAPRVSIRRRLDEITRWCVFSGGVSSPPRGVYWGCMIATPSS